MNEEPFTYRIGNLLFIYDNAYKILGCYKGNCHLYPNEFDIGIKCEAGELSKKLSHAKNLKERMDI